MYLFILFEMSSGLYLKKKGQQMLQKPILVMRMCLSVCVYIYRYLSYINI